MFKRIVNLTPHDLDVQGGAELYEDGNEIPTMVTIPPSGLVARLVEIEGEAVDTGVRIPVPGDPGVAVKIYSTPFRFGKVVVNLPPPEEGVLYVVSALVAKVALRPDVMSPGEMLRDGQGRVTGCIGLRSWA